MNLRKGMAKPSRYSHEGYALQVSPEQLLTSNHSWRWCFYINLPPGAIVAALIFFSKIPEGQIVKPKAAEVVKDLHNRLDFVGFFLFAPSITMLLLAVQWGGNE